MLRYGSLALLISVAACARPAAPVIESPARPQAPPAWEGAREVASNAGDYTVRFRTEPQPIPQNEDFAVELWVFASGGARPLDDVQVHVDAGMPEHGHGMNRVPVLAPLPDGGYRASGLLFHMPGRWELYFDIERGARTERAQVSLELE